jgi:hypothetical protein
MVTVGGISVRLLRGMGVRLGLLKPGERFTQRKYVGCIAEAAAKLVKEGFLPARVLP